MSDIVVSVEQLECDRVAASRQLKSLEREKAMRRHSRRNTIKRRKVQKIKQGGTPYYMATERYIGNGEREACKPYVMRNYNERGRHKVSSSLKRDCNRQVRRYKGEVPSYGGYRRVSDFWWTLW